VEQILSVAMWRVVPVGECGEGEGHRKVNIV
jgi:hypothetical protein